MQAEYLMCVLYSANQTLNVLFHVVKNKNSTQIRKMFGIIIAISISTGQKVRKMCTETRNDEFKQSEV